jgi:putative ABC transport system permease protein
LRNVLERRRELALLGAVGYRRSDIFAIVIAENAFLLVAGLVVGTVCALVAVAPAAMQQGGRLPVGPGAWLLLFGVLTTGLLSSFIATQVTLRTRLLGALKAE